MFTRVALSRVKHLFYNYKTTSSCHTHPFFPDNQTILGCCISFLTTALHFFSTFPSLDIPNIHVQSFYPYLSSSSLLVGDTDSIDWEFVTRIQAEGDPRPVPPLEEARQKFQFQHSLYEDAVVMPWYRNQDQPQVLGETLFLWKESIVRSLKRMQATLWKSYRYGQ